MEKRYVLRAPEGFSDGNITECPFMKVNATCTVSEVTAMQMLASQPDLEVVEVLIPNPRKRAPKDE